MSAPVFAAATRSPAHPRVLPASRSLPLQASVWSSSSSAWPACTLPWAQMPLAPPWPTWWARRCTTRWGTIRRGPLGRAKLGAAQRAPVPRPCLDKLLCLLKLLDMPHADPYLLLPACPLPGWQAELVGQQASERLDLLTRQLDEVCAQDSSQLKARRPCSARSAAAVQAACGPAPRTLQGHALHCVRVTHGLLPLPFAAHAPSAVPEVLGAASLPTALATSIATLAASTSARHGVLPTGVARAATAVAAMHLVSLAI